MSRAVRTARGAFGAFAATVLAAASHALAGGVVTPMAVFATTLLALPLCVLLAGRIGSLWRLSLAVLSAQFVFHWSFSGLGTASGLGAGLGSGADANAGIGAAAPVSAHAAHLGLASPTLVGSLADPSAAGAAVTAGAADAGMWAAHVVAAMLTIALMHRGEHAFLRLARVLRSALPVRVPVAKQLPARPAILSLFTALPSRAEPVFLSAISHRGPPAQPAPAT